MERKEKEKEYEFEILQGKVKVNLTDEEYAFLLERADVDLDHEIDSWEQFKNKSVWDEVRHYDWHLMHGVHGHDMEEWSERLGDTEWYEEEIETLKKLSPEEWLYENAFIIIDGILDHPKGFRDGYGDIPLSIANKIEQAIKEDSSRGEEELK